MHYNEQHTDQELLEMGWTQMSDRLDSEMPQKKESHPWMFFGIALLMLAGSVWHLQHNHDTKDTSPILATATTTNTDTQNNATVKPNTTVESSITSTQEDVEEEVVSTHVNATPQKTTVKLPIKQSIASQSRSVMVKETKVMAPSVASLPRVNLKQPSNRTFTTIKTQDEPASNPILSTQVRKMVEETPINRNEQIASIGFLPTASVSIFDNYIESMLPQTEVHISKNRSIKPFLSLGLLRSFTTENSGAHIGFGIAHGFKSVPRLTMRYMLSTQYLLNSDFSFANSDKDLASIMIDSEGDIESDPESTGGGIGDGEEVLENEFTNIDDFIDNIDREYQVGMSAVGYYRVSNRFSLGFGTSLIYQSFDFDGSESDGNGFISNASDQAGIDLNQFASLGYISLPIHLNRRYSLEPYYQFQINQSDIKVNQVGVNLVLSLGK